MSYVANTPKQQAQMLATCGVSHIDELFADIPPHLRPRSFDLPCPRSEHEVQRYFEQLAESNYDHLTVFLGGGFYDHFIPAAVGAIAGRSEFYTAYTPYQPELSQGTLQAIYEYQSLICRLTGMEASNASLYDGGTALYEACQMAIAATGRRRIVMDGGVNPIYRKMIRSYSANLAIELVELPVSHGRSDRERIKAAVNDQTAAMLVQNPNFFGVIDDHTDIVAHCHTVGALVVQSVYPIACAVLKSPGETGVDIVTAKGSRWVFRCRLVGPTWGSWPPARIWSARCRGGSWEERLTGPGGTALC